MSIARIIRYPRTLPLVYSVSFIAFLDTTLLVPVVALYAADLGAGVGIAGLLVGLYSIVNTPANILFGRLIDRTGYRWPLAGGLLGDALGMLLYSLCRSPLHLALVRVFHGITGAVAGPATMSAIANHSAPGREGRAMAVYGMSIAAANLLGFGLSGVVASRLGYQWLFMFGAVILLVGAVLGRMLPGTGRTVPAIPPPAGRGMRDLMHLFRRPGLVIAYAAVFAQYFSFGGVVTLLPIHLRAAGMEAFHMGMLLTVFSVAFIVVQLPGGTFSDRSGRREPVVAGLALAVVAVALLSPQTAFALLAVIMALYGAGCGLLFPSVSALVADHSCAHERGMATGVFHALLTAGVAVGAPVMGWAAEGMGVQVGLLLTPVMTALALGLALVLFRRA